MHALTVLAGSLLPGSDGAFIEAEGRDDGLERTAIGEQSDHPGEDLGIGLEAIERRSFLAGESRLADVASPSVFEAIVNMEIVLVFLAS